MMPFERPLYEVRPESTVDSLIPPADAEDTDLGALFAQRHVDVERLAKNIRAIVPPRSTATLSDIIEMYPPEDGAAEIIAYLTLDSRDDLAVHTDEGGQMAIPYTGLDGVERRMILPLVTIDRL